MSYRYVGINILDCSIHFRLKVFDVGESCLYRRLPT